MSCSTSISFTCMTSWFLHWFSLFYLWKLTTTTTEKRGAAGYGSSGIHGDQEKKGQAETNARTFPIACNARRRPLKRTGSRRLWEKWKRKSLLTSAYYGYLVEAAKYYSVLLTSSEKKVHRFLAWNHVQQKKAHHFLLFSSAHHFPSVSSHLLFLRPTLTPSREAALWLVREIQNRICRSSGEGERKKRRTDAGRSAQSGRGSSQKQIGEGEKSRQEKPRRERQSYVVIDVCIKLWLRAVIVEVLFLESWCNYVVWYL